MYEPLVSGGTVRKVWDGETELYRQHLLRLDAESRRNRFGGAVSDGYIRRYADPSALHDAVIWVFFRWRAARCRRAAPARASGGSRGRLKHREGVAEPRRRIGAVRTRAARGAQPANRVERLMLVDNWR
jgi:hypothetical protein